jgi:methionyl-tRNA formyltransferase
VRLVFAGTPEVALPSLEALLASRHEVIAVITRPDAPAGRGRTLTGSPVKERALAAGIEVLTPVRPGEPDFLAALADLRPECCPVVAYGALVPRPALEVPSQGWVNLHFSLLPAWRGAAPVQHAVLAGDEVTGATTFRLDEGMDTGPTLGALTTEIGPAETAGDLLQRLAADGAGLLVATLDAMEAGAVVAVAQPVDGVSYAPKLTVDDARIRWDAPAMRVDRLIRACTPAPGAWTTAGDDRVRLGPVQPAREADALEPGVLLVRKHEVLVGTLTHPVRLGTVQAPGKRPTPAADWARGARAAVSSFT